VIMVDAAEKSAIGTDTDSTCGQAARLIGVTRASWRVSGRAGCWINLGAHA
jgi:hypothetical protein